MSETRKPPLSAEESAETGKDFDQKPADAAENTVPAESSSAPQAARENAAGEQGNAAGERGGVRAQAEADADEESMSARRRSRRAVAEALVGEDNSARFTEMDKKKSTRKYLIFGFATLIIIALVIWLVVSLSQTLTEQGGGLASFEEIFSAMFADWHRWIYLVFALALAGAYFLFDTTKYTLINRAYHNKLGFKNNAKVALTGKYYEAITPLSTGGQPMQIYYLHKKGISGATSTSVIFVKYGIQMLSWTVVAAFVMGFGVGVIAGVQAGGDWIRIGGWVGFGVNAFIPLFVTFVIVCPRAMSAFINMFVKLFYKMKIVKRPERIEGKIRQWVSDFSLVSQFIYKKPLNFVLLFLLCLTEPLIQLSMPYFVLMALCGGDLSVSAFASMSGRELYWMCVVITMYGQYAASYIPTPGASGAMETLFMFGFADLAANKIFWVVMVWRFLNYYVYVVCGLGMNVFDIIRSFYRKHRAKKRELAAAGAGGDAAVPSPQGPPEEESGAAEPPVAAEKAGEKGDGDAARGLPEDVAGQPGQGAARGDPPEQEK